MMLKRKSGVLEKKVKNKVRKRRLLLAHTTVVPKGAAFYELILRLLFPL